MSRYYLNCMLVYLLFLPAINMFQARERYYFKYKISVFASSLLKNYPVGTALLSVLLVMTMNDRLEGRIFWVLLFLQLLLELSYTFFFS